MTTTQPPPATTTSPKPENSFRDVISLQAIVVTLTIGFLAYIQRDPDFTLKVEIGFLLLVSGPLSGLWRITRAQNETSSGLEHLYTPAVRHYAMQSFLIGMVIVGGAAIGYWAYLLPGQVLILFQLRKWDELINMFVHVQTTERLFSCHLAPNFS